MKLFDDVLSKVERSLDVRLLRHGVLAGNLANIDTPEYKPKDVDFNAAMNDAFATGGGELRSPEAIVAGLGNPAGAPSTIGSTNEMRRTDAAHFDVNGGSVGAPLSSEHRQGLDG